MYGSPIRLAWPPSLKVSGDGNSAHHVGLSSDLRAAKGQAEVIGEALFGALASGSIDVRELLVTNICCEFLTEWAKVCSSSG